MSVSPKNASQGSTVTVKVTPDSGYEIDKVTVTDSKGNTINVTDKGEGKYSFVMPDSKVDVKATFVKAEVKPGKKLPYLVIDTTKCVKCGACISGCKLKAIIKK